MPILATQSSVFFNTWLGFPPPQILLIEWGGFKQVVDHIGLLEQQAGPTALRVPFSPHNWKVEKCERVSKNKVI